jgi:hypothetical protein
LVYPWDTTRSGSRAALTASALEYLILHNYRPLPSSKFSASYEAKYFPHILHAPHDKVTSFSISVWRLVTSPPQCRRALQPFSAFRLGGEGRADTSVHGCWKEEGLGEVTSDIERCSAEGGSSSEVLPAGRCCEVGDVDVNHG